MCKIKFEKEETEKIVQVIREKYIESTNLYEMSLLKEILKKFGCNEDDWTPNIKEIRAHLNL